MKPNIGGDRHTALKLFAIEEAIRRWKERVFVVTQEAQKFSIQVGSGSIGGAGVGASRDLWPDVHVILADGAKMVGDRGWRDKQYVNPQLVIIECENEGARSTLVTGKPSMRLFAYLLLKEKHHKDGLPAPVHPRNLGEESTGLQGRRAVRRGLVGPG